MSTCNIPESHLDLLIRPLYGIFTTIMPDGHPQCSLVWVDYENGCPKINTTLERQKGKNMLKNSKVNLLVIDPKNSSRWIEIRANVELVYENAIEHLNRVTASYSPGKSYYGDIYPPNQMYNETRVVCVLHPQRVNLDAIH